MNNYSNFPGNLPAEESNIDNFKENFSKSTSPNTSSLSCSSILCNGIVKLGSSDTFISHNSIGDRLCMRSSESSGKCLKNYIFSYYKIDRKDKKYLDNNMSDIEKIKESLALNKIPDIKIEEKEEDISREKGIHNEYINSSNIGKDFSECDLESNNNYKYYNNTKNYIPPIMIIIPIYPTIMKDQTINNNINFTNSYMQNCPIYSMYNLDFSINNLNNEYKRNCGNECNNAESEQYIDTDIYKAKKNQNHPIKKKKPENIISEEVLERIQKGSEMRTTIRIKNIPPKFNIIDIENLLNESMNFNEQNISNNICNNSLMKSRPYDMIYLPPGKKPRSNIGYVFINLINSKHINLLYKKLQGVTLDPKKRKRKCEISFADIQGRDNLVNKIKNLTARPVVYTDVTYSL